ncbi:MAG: hypothetical protein ETSY1_25495 [Candidatus Entotheonella factor]|uniref:Uncharacterized protein n=1 Tax=Entotheonella factor TaxID=1429438 RepID=W4LH98_ENTF1|nr:MAG: hypothetical protein ETSY1_25495 [Candidatus Entotheonella factor]
MIDVAGGDHVFLAKEPVMAGQTLRLRRNTDGPPVLSIAQMPPLVQIWRGGKIESKKMAVWTATKIQACVALGIQRAKRGLYTGICGYPIFGLGED